MHRRAFLVLGMHRGGTSALAGALVRLGVAAPKTLLPPSAHNVLGYWESAPLWHFHDRLLEAYGSWWDAWTPLDETRQPAVTDRLAAELRGILEDEFESSPQFVVKDPRICRCVPFWLRTLRDAGIEPSCILVVRHPFEVAASLYGRDGIALERALLVWLRHQLDAEKETRGECRSIIGYRELLADGPGVLERVADELGVTWPIAPRAASADLASFLRADLCHHEAPATEPHVPDLISEWVSRTFEALSRLGRPAAGPARDAALALDEVGRALGEAAALFGIPEEAARQRDRIRAAHAESELALVRQHLSDVTAERGRHAERIARLESELEHVLRHVSAIEAESGRLREHAAALDADRARVAAEREGERLRLVDAERNAARLTAAMRGLEEHLAATKNHVDALLRSRSWRVTAPARAAIDLLGRLRSTIHGNDR